MKPVIYFDNNATTQPLGDVVEAMLPYLRDQHANPSSIHPFGQQVRHQVELAREKVAALIGALPREIVFTAGGTESINLAIRGLLRARPDRKHVITTAVEHSAVRNLCRRLADEDYEIDEVNVDMAGRLDLDALANTIRDDTALVSVMFANNETGVLFDVERIATMCSDRGVPLHVDAVQAVTKVPIDLSKCPITLLSLSAHKFHGPKGIGALYVRRRTRLVPMIVGGSQEQGFRAGTENVPGIIGMAAAGMNLSADEKNRVRQLRDRLERGILQTVPDAHVMGGSAPRIDNTTNIAFAGLEAEAILILLGQDGICASSGSACSSGSLEPSHVIAAMGIDPRIGHGAIRFSLSRFNTQDEVDRVVATMPQLLQRLAVLK